ncbi:MAG: rhomboid family intramembrane serine protease [Actinomycetota bacterium]|nr:rhomboid family intramembrane serine protease [Actinomycetota bacterium]
MLSDRANQSRREGFRLLAGIIALMWVVEVINALDHNGLDQDGIHPRDVGRLWGILTAPFLHAGFGHLIGNTVPLVFLGLIIALRGATRLAAVTAIVVLIGGLGTWLVAPGGTVTVGASGLVFGYATYLLARGVFDRSLLELLTGAVVGVVWGAALISSLVPQGNVSWQGHLWGGVGGVAAAWLLAGRRGRRGNAQRGKVAVGETNLGAGMGRR